MSEGIALQAAITRALGSKRSNSFEDFCLGNKPHRGWQEGATAERMQVFCLLLLKKREGVPEMGTKPLKPLRGYRACNRGSNRGSRGSNRGSKGSRRTPEALRG